MDMNDNQPYHHIQRAPLCFLLYAIGVMFMVLGWILRNEPGVQLTFPVGGSFVLLIAASFHHLTVEDQGDRLSIAFGPIPLFRRSVRYEDIVNVETGRTTILDGWGIHVSLRGGWLWNLWGRDGVVLRLRKGMLRVGTDDAEQLAEYVKTRSADANKLTSSRR